MHILEIKHASYQAQIYNIVSKCKVGSKNEDNYYTGNTSGIYFILIIIGACNAYL